LIHLDLLCSQQPNRWGLEVGWANGRRSQRKWHYFECRRQSKKIFHVDERRNRLQLKFDGLARCPAISRRMTYNVLFILEPPQI
jgi:hypothetical protein